MIRARLKPQGNFRHSRAGGNLVKGTMGYRPNRMTSSRQRKTGVLRHRLQESLIGRYRQFIATIIFGVSAVTGNTSVFDPVFAG
jgi:hypothetical protein